MFAWEMDSVMVYIKDQMDNMYSEIYTVSRYMNVKVNCFYSNGVHDNYECCKHVEHSMVSHKTRLALCHRRLYRCRK